MASNAGPGPGAASAASLALAAQVYVPITVVGSWYVLTQTGATQTPLANSGQHGVAGSARLAEGGLCTSVLVCTTTWACATRGSRASSRKRGHYAR